LAEGRVRAHFHLPLEPSLNDIIRQHAVVISLAVCSVAKTFIAWFDVAAIGLVLQRFAVHTFQVSLENVVMDSVRTKMFLASFAVQFLAGTL